MKNAKQKYKKFLIKLNQYDSPKFERKKVNLILITRQTVAKWPIAKNIVTIMMKIIMKTVN